MKYVADDGTVFSTEAECLAYENTPMKQLENLIKDKIDRSYNDDAGFSIIEESAVLGFIVSHIDEINKILKTKDELSTSVEWISNIGRSRVGHPESLSADTKVEVKLRNGATEVGNAKYWYYQWIEVAEYSRNIDWDIIAYRVL